MSSEPVVGGGPQRYPEWLEATGRKASAASWEAWVSHVHAHKGYKVDQLWPGESRSRDELTREDVIGLILAHYEKTGKTPRAGTVVNDRAVLRLFGTWPDAVRAAGLEPLKRGSQKMVKKA